MELCKFKGPNMLEAYAQEHVLDKELSQDELSEYTIVVAAILGGLIAKGSSKPTERRHILTMAHSIILKELEDLEKTEKKASKTAVSTLSDRKESC